MFNYNAISDLQADLAAMTNARDANWSSFMEAQEKVGHLNDAYADAANELAEQTAELVEQRATNEALNRENADLIYQIDLYRSVLKQMRLTLDLPARKK